MLRENKYEILNDDARWADPQECVDLCIAGIWFLHETIQSRFTGCPLSKRIGQLRSKLEQSKIDTQGDPSRLSLAVMVSMLSEINLLGTLGYSLWHLRDYLRSAALNYELGELSQVSDAGSEADTLRLRGHGFLLLAAATIAKQRFVLEFIARRKHEATPDFFAIRDGNRFACEVTTRQPAQGDFESVDFFWSKIIEAIERKARQFRSPEFQEGVLIVDCSSVWEAFGLSELAVGQLVYSIPPEIGGPRNGSVPILRYDECKNPEKLRSLEHAIRGTNIHTLILWHQKLEVLGTTYRRGLGYCVIGTIAGAKFWSYFPKALAIPGPEVNVKWES